MPKTLIATALAASPFPVGNSELAALIRGFDWSATDLGPISSWPGYLRSAVEMIVQSPVPMILLCGADGIMIYNNGYAEIAGLRHPNILGGQVAEGWPEIADFNRHVLKQCLAGRILTYHDQNMVLLRNGLPEEAFFDIYYSPVYSSHGDAGAVLAVVHETTKRVVMERQRDDADKALIASNLALQHANSDLEQFAFSASHDLQEPLRMVSVYSQLLQRKLAGKLDLETDILLRHCIDGALRLDSLMKGLLEYTRASAEPVSGATLCNLNDVLQESLDLLLASIQDSDAEITTDPLPVLRVQPIHLQQIFQNLIGNAIKYRSNRPLRVHVGAKLTDNIWTLSVADNGIGFHSAYKDQIFGLFKRLHGSSEYSGTGLGLAICKKLVDRYGGNMWAESALGSGATFYFTLPEAQ